MRVGRKINNRAYLNFGDENGTKKLDELFLDIEKNAIIEQGVE